MGRFDEMHARSLADPEGFWGEAAEALSWERRWRRVCDDSNAPFYRWFAGGELNTCYNAVDRHVEGGRADQLALVYDSPGSGGSTGNAIFQTKDDRVREAVRDRLDPSERRAAQRHRRGGRLAGS